jgi:hypothetical protein
MKIPQSITEKLLYTTIRLEIGDTRATGFIFDPSDNNSNPMIITNRHVIEEMKTSLEVKFYLHFVENGEISPKFLEVVMESQWFVHPEHDLVSCPLKTILAHVVSQGMTPYYQSITHTHIPTQEQLDNLNASEEVIMIGYPNGLWDEANNLPILRKGYTASHPAYNFRNSTQQLDIDGYGVVDMACFPGSSGSPIFILNENGYYDKMLGKHVMGSTRIIFLGVLFKGPLFIQQTIKEDHTPLMMNLGYYIRASKVVDICL